MTSGYLKQPLRSEAEARNAAAGWIVMPDEPANPCREKVERAAPFDGKPVLIATDHRNGSRVHQAAYVDPHDDGWFSWCVDDDKHGPFPLRGYNAITHWRPLPDPPEVPQ